MAKSSGTQRLIALVGVLSAILALSLLAFQNVSAMCDATGLLCPGTPLRGKSDQFVVSCEGSVVYGEGMPYESSTVLRIDLKKSDPTKWQDYLQRPIIVDTHAYVANAVVALVNNCTHPTCTFVSTDSKIEMEMDHPLLGTRYFSLSRVTGEYRAGGTYHDIVLDAGQKEGFRKGEMISISEGGTCRRAEAGL